MDGPGPRDAQAQSGRWLVPGHPGGIDEPARRALGIILAGVSLACLVAGALVQGGTLDRTWMLALAAGQGPVPLQMLWSSLTVAGFGWACLILLMAADRRDGRLVALLLPVLALTGGVTHALKQGWSTVRPAGSEIGAQVAVIGERIQGLGSTPSGHALAAAATATLLMWWYGSGRGGWRLMALIGLTGLGVAVSRVMVGAHWPADVLLGLGVGIALVLGLILALGRWPSLARLWEQLAVGSATPRGQRIVAALEVLAVAGLVATPTGYPLGWPMEVLLCGLGLGSAGMRWRRASR